MRYDSPLAAVGNTPLVRLPRLSPSEDVRFLDGINTALGDNDNVTILPAVAGGSV